MLDGEDRVAGREQPPEDREKDVDVPGVKPGRRLVEEEEGRPRAAPGPEERGDLQPLGLASRESRRRLPEPEVPEAGLRERGQA